ncbi:MAG: MBL fold metallo-hydrolase [Vicinamibacterales bacterium]
MAAGSRWLNADTAQIDLLFQGAERVIASYMLDIADGLAIVDTGPSSTLARLLEGITELGRDPRDIRHLIMTHIHLDHAGAAGTIVERYPDCRVYVHEIGAPHLVDPTSLVRSATRIYGEQMEPLWGEIVPVPGDRINALTDGDRLDIGGRRLDVHYTPGHASHHVAVHDLRHNVTFVGDVAGIRIPPSTDALPPTPPPDIDVDLWHASVALVRKLRPELILLAHFGVVDDVARHLDLIDQRLDDWLRIVETSAANGLESDAIADRLRADVESRTVASDTESIVEQIEFASPYGMSVDGLLRYLRKRSE